MKKEIIEVSTMTYFKLAIGISCLGRKRREQRWSIELGLIEHRLRWRNVESRLRTLNTCLLKRRDRDMNFGILFKIADGFSMRNNSRMVDFRSKGSVNMLKSMIFCIK